VSPPRADGRAGAELPFRAVASLRIGEQVFHTWQEAQERRIELTGVVLGELLRRSYRQAFTFPGRRWQERLRGPAGDVVGVLVRRQEAIQGTIEFGAAPLAGGLFKFTLRVANDTPLDEPETTSRDSALLRSLVSTNTILGVRQGEFVSLLDPPEPCREAAATCRNIGTWPVLVGDAGQRDTILSSPIILYDYPQVAPESPGNLFDGAEIDEILTLRILTLTDEEKQAAAAVDDRVRELLARTESLAREELLALHGTVRTLRPLPSTSEKREAT
jgi:hydrogenase maturation protease